MSDQPADGGEQRPRVLVITPCHNDGWALSSLAESMVAQRLVPARWLVVDDASTDETPEVVAKLEEMAPFVSGFRRERPPGRRIAEKARAIMAAYASVEGDRFDYVAIVDADIIMPEHYFARVDEIMSADPSLGVTGGIYVEPGERAQAAVAGRTAGSHVPGAAQVFRREVFDGVGGYQPLPYGGDDVVSVTRARMLGHRTAAAEELVLAHGRRMGTGGHGSPLRAARTFGRQDHDLGTWWPFEIIKVVRYATQKPYGLIALVRAIGFVELKLRRQRPTVDADYVAFVRREQRQRLAAGPRRLMARLGRPLPDRRADDPTD